MRGSRWSDHFSEDEQLLTEQPLSAVLRHAAARAEVDAEEEDAALSTRPTVAIYDIEPWR